MITKTSQQPSYNPQYTNNSVNNNNINPDPYGGGVESVDRQPTAPLYPNAQPEHNPPEYNPYQTPEQPKNSEPYMNEQLTSPLNTQTSGSKAQWGMFSFNF